MADDREILREVWEGRLPVCFQLAPEEVHSMQQPDPYYLLVPRLSYFPLVTDKVRKHFVRHVDPDSQDNEMWLEYDSSPLKWHYPIGVLFDLNGSDTMLPWNITVHFQRFPEKDLFHCPGREAVEAHFMSCVKEADALKHRGLVISGMQKRDHNQLWLGLQNDKFDQFWGINRKLMERSNEEPFKYVPFKLYQPEKPYTQRLFKPHNEGGEVQTLRHLIQEVAPEVLESGSSQRVVIQGVSPPLETPLQWLSEHCSHPDNFLHICVSSS